MKDIMSFSAILCLAASTSGAQQICDSVLNRDLVNVRSIEVSESIIARMQADVCSREYNSASAAQQYMRTGGWSLDVFGYFDNSLNDTKNRGSSSYQVQESEFCNQSAAFHSSNLATNVSEANASLVLGAYTECIRLTQESGLWMTYEIVEDGRALRGTLRRRATQNTPLGYSVEELSINTTDSATTVQCNLTADSQTLEGQAIEAREIDAGTATFTCIKSGNGAAFVDLRTSIVEFPLYMPSDEAVEHAELDDLRDQLQALRRELEEDRAALSAVQDSIPTAVSISTSVLSGQGFNDVPNWTEIPGSRGAAYCALTRVDDDSPVGACFVGRQNGRWVYRTGGGGGDNLCTAHCFTISADLR